MPGNPLVPQGVLNRVLSSISVTNFPGLNITAPFVGKAGLHLLFGGVSTTFIDTMTGAVTSLEPYQTVMVTCHLLKTQGLAAAYETQRLTSSLLGDIVARSDTTTLPPYALTNCAIENVRDLDFSGMDAGYVLELKGYYIINNSLFN